MHRVIAWVCLALIVGLAGPARAITIKWGDIEVRRLTSYGLPGTNSILSFDSGSTDELYQMFAYVGNASGVVRVDAANFDVVTGISALNNVATSSISLGATGASALGLALSSIQIDYTFTLIDDTTPADGDQFLWDVTINNLSGVDQTLVFYTYLDLDLDGPNDFGDDQATANTSRILVTDPDTGKTFVWEASNGGPASHFEVGLFPQVRNKLDGMVAAVDLADGSVSFGPSDFSGAFQYDLFIPAGTAVTLTSGSFGQVPEPDTALLVVLGLAGLAMAPRAARSLRTPSRERSSKVSSRPSS